MSLREGRGGRNGGTEAYELTKKKRKEDKSGSEMIYQLLTDAIKLR